MKRLAPLALLLALTLPAQEITLQSVEWTIDPDCPGTGGDDTVEVTLTWEGMAQGKTFHVERAQQTTPSSCPHTVESTSVSVNVPEGSVTFTAQETTEIHKAFRWRLLWTVSGSLRVRDFLLEPPGGGDNCFEPPDAPDCPTPALTILDEPQVNTQGATWDLGGEGVSVIAFDASGETAFRDDEPSGDTYAVTWPGPCPCPLVALVAEEPSDTSFFLGNGGTLALWQGQNP